MDISIITPEPVYEMPLPSHQKKRKSINGKCGVDVELLKTRKIDKNDTDINEVTLSSAFEDKIRPHIDLVDELRCYGLDQDINLPSVVVIGDQSSGKSSILEAISGIQLPRGSGIVTRCPLEMQLKRSNDPDASWQSCLIYEGHGGCQKKSTTDPNKLEKMIRAAQNEVAGDKKGISESLITLKVEAPMCPDVTLIDLPGIARTAVEGQPQNICEVIKRLLKSYIAKSHTIILCVIPSNVDIAVNEALSLAREYDPEGMRTLGVITKPDLVDKGTENDVIAVLNNEKFQLSKGYSIVRCRGQQEIIDGVSLEDALNEEERFFTDHPVFCDVNLDMRGTRNLAMKLTENLVEHIEKALPKLKADVEMKYDHTNKQLRAMSVGPPVNESEKRQYLFDVMQKFLTTMDGIVNKGDYMPSHVFSSKQGLHEQTKECRTSYLWRTRFAKLKEDISKITEESLLCDLSTQSLQKNICFFRGPELPNFMNFELFTKFVVLHIGKYERAINECLNLIISDLKNIIDYVCDQQLTHLPALRSQFRTICTKLQTECKETGISLLELEMQKENLVFTQDDTFMKERNEGPTSPFASLPYQSQTNAEEMHRSLKVYLTVANRRIVDNIPMIIRTTQHDGFISELRRRLLELTSSKNVEELVREDASVARKRRLLQDKSRRLTIAMEKLSKQ